MIPADGIVRPLASLLLSAVVPFASWAALAPRFLRNLPPGGDERARLLAPLRRAAFLVGLAQIQLAWMMGVTALGPTWGARPGGLASLAFGGLCAAAAFMAGGVARRTEEPRSVRSSALGAARLRLRLVPWFAGPLAVAVAAGALPLAMLEPLGGTAVRWASAALALLICVMGVAYGGLALALLTGALRLAPASLRRIAREVTSQEGARLALVLRLPTPGARLANAAALPWARTMVITDEATRLLSGDQLRAVLAHEAAHLSERPLVSMGRLGAATAGLFAIVVLPRLSGQLPTGVAIAVMSTALVAAVALLLAVRRLARRMEERADAHAARSIGPVTLAEALRRIHVHAQQPMNTGRRRVHPDLYDRLIALGVDPGPRPPRPPRGGTAFGLAIGLALLGIALALHLGTDVSAAEVTTTGPTVAQGRLLIDPWDAEARLALAWDARRRGDLDAAKEHALTAGRAGAAPVPYWTAWAEILAARGACAAAREAYDRARRTGADATLGEGAPAGPAAQAAPPPTLARRCGL